MHPTLQKVLGDHADTIGRLPQGADAFLHALDAAFYELELTASNEISDSEGIAALMLERVPAIIYAAEFGPVEKCHYASPQIRTILGYEPSDWTRDAGFWFDHLHPDDRTTAIDADLHTQRTGEPLSVEYRMIARDGRTVWIRDEGVVVQDGNGKPVMIHGLMYNITEQKLANEKLLHEATHDSLTGLPNRALLNDRIDYSIARSRRENDYRFAVICIGLDRFKTINESIGPRGGDQLLVEFARRLRECVRPADTVARTGGDEFVLVAEGVRATSDADAISARVQAELARPFVLNGTEVFVTSSIGIALSRGGEDKHEDLLRDADIALHHAKRGGKDRHQVFDADMHTTVVKQLQMENDLRRAIDRDEFEVHYQPILSLHTGSIDSVEALVRWRHPDRGLVPPMEFIPIAEETGLIAPIERIVMAKSCKQLAEWNRKYGQQSPIALSVNLSARRFAQADLVDDLLKIIVPSGLPADLIKLEITETAIMNNRDEAEGMLDELKRMNLRISLDDFGTGYSSLSYLHKFPIDVVKIDRSFVKMIDTPGQGDEIVRTIVSLAHNLEMAVTAEGIETDAQLQRLRELGCEFGQGYYFAKPLDGVAMEQMLAQRVQRKRTAA